MGFLIQLSLVIIVIVLLLLYKLCKLLFEELVYWLEVLIEKSAKNSTLRNNILSILYFLREIGPNVSSFSIVALVVTNGETTFQLTVLFILGIILKEISRVATAKFCKLVELKRKEDKEKKDIK